MSRRAVGSRGVVVAVATAALLVGAAPPVSADRGRPDTIGVVRDTEYLLRDATGAGPVSQRRHYGLPGDVPVVGDWDGDGRATPGVFRGRTWLLRNDLEGGGAQITFAYGLEGDVPVVGDWDGDGVDTIGVYRGRRWYLRNRNSSGVPAAVFDHGLPGDVPVAGDWDGDGVDTIGVYRGRRWYLRNRNSSGGTDIAFDHGLPGDVPVAGDWDGDGVDTIGVYRGRRWYLRNRNSSGGTDVAFDYGLVGDVPVTGHWRDAFRARPLPAGVRARMDGISWRPGCPVGLDDLSLLEVRHHGFDGRIADGRLVVADHVAGPVLGVFRRLFDAGFPIERMRLVDDYRGSDDASMAANNTSAFNCRRVSGSSAWSQHSYGTAVDLNPVQNPYVRGASVQPPSGAPYRARVPVRPGMIVRPGPVVDAFARIGWGWGGDWTSAKDYQHVSANGR